MKLTTDGHEASHDPCDSRASCHNYYIW